MPCQILIAATTHRKQVKGQMIVVRDEPVIWGGKEVPPAYVVLRISNTTAKKVIQFLAGWGTNFEHGVTTNPDLSRQITVSISQKILDIFGAVRGLKLSLKEYLENEWEATVISWSPTVRTMVFDVPAGTDLAALEADLLDKYEEHMGPRWLFSEADVDTALAAGGFIELNKAQAEARIIDRAV